MAEYITKDEALLQLTGINLPKDRDSYIALITKCMKKIKALIAMDNEQHSRTIKLSELKEVLGL